MEKTMTEEKSALVRWGRCLDGMPSVTRNASGHGYRYATLEHLRSVVRPVLREHGFRDMACPESDEKVAGALTTIVCRQSGLVVAASRVVFPLERAVTIRDRKTRQVMHHCARQHPENPAQDGGSLITYAMRYGLAGLCGVSFQDDDDATGVSGESKDWF